MSEWVRWRGGDNPVPGKIVSFQLRNGTSWFGLSDDMDWSHDYRKDDIVLYSVKSSEWIEWHGGECPIASDEPAAVRFRNGAVFGFDSCPKDLIWRHDGDEGDIVAYRTVKDLVNHPPHYTSHPSGVECIDVTKHMDFCLGNAMKYIWRAGIKDEAKTVEDLKKAVFYINKKIEMLESES